MSRYRVALSGERDLTAIIDYLAKEAGRPAVDAALTMFIEAFERLAEAPNIGVVRDALTGPTHRWWYGGRYAIIFEPSPPPITVLPVLHPSRDLESLLSAQP